LNLWLSRQIWRGVLDYAKAKPDWYVEAMDLDLVLRGVLRDGWDGFDALIISEGPRSREFRQSAHNFPIVTTHFLGDEPVDQVDGDPEATGRLAADFFLKHLPRRYACLRSYDSLAHHRREDAFVAQVEAADIGADCRIFHSTKMDSVFRDEALCAEVMDWAKAGSTPVGIFCTDDGTAGFLLRWLMQAGVSIPAEVQILGCEDDELRCEGLPVTLSSVRMPYRQVGFEAARILDLRLRGQSGPAEQISLPPEGVTERASTSNLQTRDRPVQSAIDYLTEHQNRSLSIEEVARHAGLSPSALRKRFKEAIGRSPKAELLRLRMRRVEALIRDTELSLEEIAEATGFPSGVYLSKIFRTKTGQTVRQYRRKVERERVRSQTGAEA